MGGAINRYEVANLLEAAPTAAAFHRLGHQPKLIIDAKEEPQQPLGLRFLSDYEAGSVEALRQSIKVKEMRLVDYQNQHKLLKMVNERAKRAMQHLGRDNKNAICGYDCRLSFNIDEFIIWFAGEEAQNAFSTDILGPMTNETRRLIPFLPQMAPATTTAVVNGDSSDDFKDICLIPKRNKCQKHQFWRELHNQEFGELITQCRADIVKLEREIINRVERAETREATALYYADNRTRFWDSVADPVPVS